MGKSSLCICSVINVFLTAQAVSGYPMKPLVEGFSVIFDRFDVSIHICALFRLILSTE